MDKNLNIWERSKSLLVFYVYSNYNEFESFRDSINLIMKQSHIKRFKVIIYIKNPKENILKDSMFSYIRDKDISIIGNKIKKNIQQGNSENLELILSAGYDLFLCFGQASKRITKWLMKMNSQKKVGINSDEHSFFDMNLESSKDSIDNSVNFTINMLSKII